MAENKYLDDSRTMYLCMGSACHRLGVYDIYQKLKVLMTNYNLEGEIVLKGHFCLNNCSEGVIIKIGDHTFERILPDNVDRIFENEIYPHIKGLLKVTH